MTIRRLAFFLFLAGLFVPFAFASAGTVLSAYKYAWSNRAGYINFENVVVGNSALSGYAWSQNYGWIKFNPATGGVSNDGTGNLSGYAWGESLGWINFDGVSINSSTGRFSGTATGTLVGTINFDCPTYCDVRTDWQPSSTTICTSWTYSDWSACSGGTQTRTVLSSLPAGCAGGSPILSQSCSAGGGSLFIASVPPPHVDALNQDLVITPDESGLYTKDTSAGQVSLAVPARSVFAWTRFIISLESLIADNKNLVLENTQLINSVFYNITAKDQDGNLVHFFSYPVTITLPMPANMINAPGLGVYWLNETNEQWVLIPDAVFWGDRVTFQVNHLTKFAIFADKTVGQPVSTLITKPKPTIPLFPGKKPAIGATTTVEQNQPVTKKTLIEKIKDFFEPLVPSFLKPSKISNLPENELVEHATTTVSATTTVARVGGKKITCLWWLILILLLGAGVFYQKYLGKKK